MRRIALGLLLVTAAPSDATAAARAHDGGTLRLAVLPRCGQIGGRHPEGAVLRSLVAAPLCHLEAGGRVQAVLASTQRSADAVSVVLRTERAFRPGRRSGPPSWPAPGPERSSEARSPAPRWPRCATRPRRWSNRRAAVAARWSFRSRTPRRISSPPSVIRRYSDRRRGPGRRHRPLRAGRRRPGPRGCRPSPTGAPTPTPSRSPRCHAGPPSARSRRGPPRSARRRRRAVRARAPRHLPRVPPRLAAAGRSSGAAPRSRGPRPELRRCPRRGDARPPPSGARRSRARGGEREPGARLRNGGLDVRRGPARPARGGAAAAESSSATPECS